MLHDSRNGTGPTELGALAIASAFLGSTARPVDADPIRGCSTPSGLFGTERALATPQTLRPPLTALRLQTFRDAISI
jgi:hypothetical protein